MFRRVSSEVFRYALGVARDSWSQVEESTSDPSELPDSADFYLSEDGASGYGVNDGELISVFSLVRGRGDFLVTSAKASGAVRGDCFDGYLTEFYARHGFHEVSRVANWTVGEPDVVFFATV